LATDRQTDKQTDEQMDSSDALSRSRYRERRLNNDSFFHNKESTHQRPLCNHRIAV